MKIKEIKINSVNDISTCINLASSLELAGWPKPGNVHRTKNFTDTRYEHFLSGIAAIQPLFLKFCEKIFNKTEIIRQEFAFVELGKFFKEAVKAVMNWQSGGNILLGHILILTPLSAAASICIKRKTVILDNFRKILGQLIEDATVQDTINLYTAIRICKPGGLGKIEKYDLNDDKVFLELERDGVKLKQIFEFSESYDLISSEYATGFNIILTEGLPYFVKTFNEYNDINTATVNSFLKLLSKHPDSLIIRKMGKLAAEQVSKLANKALKKGGVSTNKGLKLTLKLDKRLHKKKGKLNPGTTADLIAGTLFCALIFGLKF